MQRTINFYSTVLDGNSKMGGPMDYWLIKTGQPGEPGIDGGMMPRDPQQPCVNT
jgi:predicted enzyme related to lactoylglutathione lyase